MFMFHPNISFDAKRADISPWPIQVHHVYALKLCQASALITEYVSTEGNAIVSVSSLTFKPSDFRC